MLNLHFPLLTGLYLVIPSSLLTLKVQVFHKPVLKLMMSKEEFKYFISILTIEMLF